MRSRRKKSEMPFADALEAAEKRLKKAQKERDEAVKTLTCLDGEIPALQTTISALRQQLNPSGTIATLVTQTVKCTYCDFEGSSAQITQHLITRHGFTNPITPPENLTEDDLLPEPDGVPLVEE